MPTKSSSGYTQHAQMSIHSHDLRLQDPNSFMKPRQIISCEYAHKTDSLYSAQILVLTVRTPRDSCVSLLSCKFLHLMHFFGIFAPVISH
jgi:hypothetical protein